jgi:hypothetical protein
MKLIMRSEFDNLRLNDEHGYQTDCNGDKQITRLYHNDILIAKKIHCKRKVRYFGIEGYAAYLRAESDAS